jgi:hypothetical protein
MPHSTMPHFPDWRSHGSSFGVIEPQHLGSTKDPILASHRGRQTPECFRKRLAAGLRTPPLLKALLRFPQLRQYLMLRVLTH